MSEELKQPEMPRTYYVGRMELIAWLEEWGIKPWRTRELIEAGTLPQHCITGFKKRRKYVPQEVARILELGGAQ